jgi:hypothetical protein
LAAQGGVDLELQVIKIAMLIVDRMSVTQMRVLNRPGIWLLIAGYYAAEIVTNLESQTIEN